VKLRSIDSGKTQDPGPEPANPEFPDPVLPRRGKRKPKGKPETRTKNENKSECVESGRSI